MLNENTHPDSGSGPRLLNNSAAEPRRFTKHASTRARLGRRQQRNIGSEHQQTKAQTLNQRVRRRPRARASTRPSWLTRSLRERRRNLRATSRCIRKPVPPKYKPVMLSPRALSFLRRFDSRLAACTTSNAHYLLARISIDGAQCIVSQRAIDSSAHLREHKRRGPICPHMTLLRRSRSDQWAYVHCADMARRV